jgi:PTS system ascorbate-specific IIA component
LIKLEHIQVLDQVENWEESIKVAAGPLLKDGIITESYLNKMIDNVHIMGAYIVISNDIAMPHARPEDGARETAISILKLKNRVRFTAEKEVNVILALACSTNEDHIRTLKYVSTVLSDKQNYLKLMKAESIDELYSLFNGKEVE